MSNTDGDPGRSRRTFGLILGGLAAGAVLGTTVVAHADDNGETELPEKAKSRARPMRGGDVEVRRIDSRDIDSLAAKLDALKLSESERALLVGLLSVATDTIRRSTADNPISPLVAKAEGGASRVGVRKRGPMPTIRDQFRDAFSPGAVRAAPFDEPDPVIFNG